VEKKVEREDWRKIVSQNLDYYLNTEEGRKELFNMARAEAEYLIEEIKKRKRDEKIIWLSKYCFNCVHFYSKNLLKCKKWNSRLVKPFYGKVKWKHKEEDLFISDFDWNSKAFNVSDIIVELAIEKINKGMPYFCFEPSE